MSLPNQNAPRMRRHKRRINDDGSDLAHAVRSFIDQQSDDSTALLARQADGANGVGPGGNRGNGAPAMGGGFANTGTGSDGSNGAGNANSNSATATSTRGSFGNGNSGSNGDGSSDDNNGNVRPTATATATSTTPLRNLHPTTSTTSSSTDFLDGILGGLGFTSSSSTSSTPTSTSTSSSATSTTSSTTSSSSRSSSSSSSSSTSSSTSRSSIVPITATAVVTATPTASLAAAASATPKSTSSSAGPIIGIVAGALVGVVVLSGLIGFLFKKYKKQDDPYESNPFDRDAFQRHSAMIPDHYESDEGHGGAGGMTPEISEHYQQYNNFSPQYESGMSAGAAGAAGAMGAMGAMAAHNETGGPRPPTMFAKHAAGVQQNQPQVGAYYKDGDFSNQMNSMPPHSDYHAPPVAAFANHHNDQQYLDEPGFGQSHRAISPAPQLPPLAAFGGDPYSIAGVGRGQQQQQNHNVANPYAHLDRSHGAGSFVPGTIVSPGGGHTAGSGSVSSGADSADQRHASINAAEALAAGLAHQSSLNRSTSPNAVTYDTAGRPGTSEGRSGTPDIPNVQQTYALSGDVAARGSGGSQDAQLRNPFDNPAAHQQQQQQQLGDHQQLQVRNLVPNGGLSAGQRPISTASSLADPEDAYGGVY